MSAGHMSEKTRNTAMTACAQRACTKTRRRRGMIPQPNQGDVPKDNITSHTRHLSKVSAVLLVVAVAVIYVAQQGRAQKAQKGEFDSRIDANAQRMMEEGRRIFRFDTFGD